MAPKHCVDTSKQEVMRSVRVTNMGKLDVLAMRIPSKVGGFNQEYYPPFNANEPSSTAEQWSNGQDVPAKTMQLGPANQTKAKGKAGGLKNMLNKKNAPAAATNVVEESKGGASGGDAEALRAQVAQLQAELSMARSAAVGDALQAAESFDTVPVLGYWKIRGLAAQIRYMFYYL